MKRQEPKVKILASRQGIVIYRVPADQLSEAKVSWNGPPWKVKALYGVGEKLGDT